ncbi:DUF2785 domain-containing protein [Alteromonas facilis]|uniref:DUF2785 domain-containing protein n=1 Tax=Alteromonas facilis TaxID=2048004 RepID=UPI000C28423F|nr:DUF2785 domain-containing protein [Alteromonas facilis]
MRFVLATIFLLLSSSPLVADETPSGCFSSEWDKKALLDLKSQAFEISEQEARDELALQLLACLAEEDPAIRDGVAYEALTQWLRSESLADDTIAVLHSRVADQLASGKNDSEGFLMPFNALIFAEIVRVDRISPFLSDEQFNVSVLIATEYVKSVSDYRGFDEKEGWRHGVAHGADILLQLALNSRLNKSQADALLLAIASQVVPDNNHFYIYGEPRRLALPSLYVWLAGLHELQEWQTWLDEIVHPAPLDSWRQAYQSQTGLSQLHNVRQYLMQLLALVEGSENEKITQLKPSIINALKTVG